MYQYITQKCFPNSDGSQQLKELNCKASPADRNFLALWCWSSTNPRGVAPLPISHGTADSTRISSGNTENQQREQAKRNTFTETSNHNPNSNDTLVTACTSPPPLICDTDYIRDVEDITQHHKRNEIHKSHTARRTQQALQPTYESHANRRPLIEFIIPQLHIHNSDWKKVTLNENESFPSNNELEDSGNLLFARLINVAKCGTTSD